MTVLQLGLTSVSYSPKHLAIFLINAFRRLDLAGQGADKHCANVSLAARWAVLPPVGNCCMRLCAVEREKCSSGTVNIERPEMMTEAEDGRLRVRSRAVCHEAVPGICRSISARMCAARVCLWDTTCTRILKHHHNIAFSRCASPQTFHSTY
jgi:hypothetical protein